MKNTYIGSTFDSFLEEEGIREEVENGAVKKLISYQLLETQRQDNSIVKKRYHCT